MKRRAPAVHGLDSFRSPRAKEVADRWEQARRAHQAAANRMWLGAMVAEFDGFELTILRDMGFLSPADHALLGRAGRSVEE